VYDLSVRRADETAALERPQPNDSVAGGKLADESTGMPEVDGRKPGRQALCREMEEEMNRRAHAGKMLPTLAGEVRAPLTFRAKHPDVKTGKAKLPEEGSARNHLREPYKKLREGLEAQ